MEKILVKMAGLATAKGDAMLQTIGLGSCVGVVLFSKKEQVAGLAHIMLPESPKKTSLQEALLAKFADTAIPLLIEQLEREGVKREKIEAKLVGGAEMFKATLKLEMLQIGKRNVEACRLVLSSFRIPIVAQATGGDCGRTIEHYCATSCTLVKTVFRGESWI